MWRNGGSGGNFSAIPPKASLPPYCVIKNGTLIFREKWSCNGLSADFLRRSKKCSQKVRGKKRFVLNELIINIATIKLVN